MSETIDSDENAAADLMLALVRKACDNLFSLATSVGKINSLKRLTVLMELQKSWEDGSSEYRSRSAAREVSDDRLLSTDDKNEPPVQDIIVCHDCGRCKPHFGRRTRSHQFVCNHCGQAFQKCFSLMRHLLDHNNKNNKYNHDNDNDTSTNKKLLMGANIKIENNSEFECNDEEDEEDDGDDDDDDDDDGDDDDDDDEYRNGDDDDATDDSGGLKNQKKRRFDGRDQKMTVNFAGNESNGMKKEEEEEEEEEEEDCRSNEDDDATNDSRRDDKLQLASSKYSFFPKLECPACGRHFRRTNSLKNHMAIHTSRGPFFSHTQRTVSSNHTARYKRPRSPSDGDGRPALCCDCGKQFVNLKRLKIHSLSHSAPGRYSCDKCPLKFSVAASLKRHLQRHTGVRPHVCSKCGKSFVRSDELAAHERLHSNRNMFPCPVCGKGFTRSIDMVRHQSCHETTKPYRCSQCDKSFVRQDFLKKHESTHLSRVCPFCKDVFENRRNITLHIKREHPDKSVEDLFTISQSKLVQKSKPYGETQSIISLLEPSNLYEVPRSSLQIDLSPLVDDNASAVVLLSNAQELAVQSAEREEFS